MPCRSEVRRCVADPTWDFQNPASKGRLLGVLWQEIDEMRGFVQRHAASEAIRTDRGVKRHVASPTAVSTKSGQPFSRPLELPLIQRARYVPRSARRRVWSDVLHDRGEE